MSKFINTQRKDTIDSLLKGMKDKLNNPYYANQDKQPTPVTYYNANQKKTTLDPGSKLAYAMNGSDSPIKLNKINNFLLYGLERIEVNLDNGDFGLESDPIDGEATILPNTIVPTPNDFFSIDHLGKTILFRVNKVAIDTIENDANFYKITYKMDQYSADAIKDQIVDEYDMLVENIGGQFNTIIKNTDYKFIQSIEEYTLRLKKYYKELFYSPRVQTFIFCYNSTNFYDPYMIEFLINNKILSGDEEYLFITHQTTISNIFGINYDKTMFRAIELGELKDKYRATSTALLIDEQLSILTSRFEDYYMIDYIPNNNPNLETVYNFDLDLIQKIKDNQLYDSNIYKNIIIKYFLNQQLTGNDIESIKDIDYEVNIRLFYDIPILIYVLEHYIKQLLTK